MRSKGWLLLGVAFDGALALLAATQTWVVIALSPGAAAVERLELPGYDLNPAFSPVAIAALAAALALTISGRVLRLVLGALIVLLGIGIAAMAFAVLGDPSRAAAGRVADASGIAGSGQLAIIEGAEATTWPSVAIAAGIVLVALGVLVVWFGGRWKTGGRKYASVDDRSSTLHRDASHGEPDRIADWDAMNHGEDPT